ncbi:MAG: tRNA (N(6)-L-threonylcarbamoyladenosine(37)-C(2))-methylthiotransferase MtaB [Candidatus Omnitrophota bacterium]
MSLPKKPTFIIKTLGCKVNQYESEAMRKSLMASGFAEGGAGGYDICIINSCTVTHKADRDTRRLARHYKARNPLSLIIVAGCGAETADDRRVFTDMEEVDLLAGNKEKSDIPGLLRRAGIKAGKAGDDAVRNREGSRNRLFVKVQDGCDRRCAYCKVPLVRGKSISVPEEDVLGEIRGLVSCGAREIVLTGVCLGAWGRDLPGNRSLPDLLGMIAGLDGDFRLRLSSIEPEHVTPGLKDAVKKDRRICRHLHIPLQSGDDGILKRMNRAYSAGKFLDLINSIRAGMPEIAFTTDVIAGFPGEDDKSFSNTCAFLEKLRPSRTHIFSYSARKGTAAYSYRPLVRSAVVKERMRTLMGLAEQCAFDFAAGFKGRTVDMLVESARDRQSGLLTGYSGNYIRILLRGEDGLKNRIMPVVITDVKKSGVYGQLA